MDDDRDIQYLPRIDGFGSASTLNPLPPPPKFRKMGRIGFKFPKPAKAKK